MLVFLMRLGYVFVLLRLQCIVAGNPNAWQTGSVTRTHGQHRVPPPPQTRHTAWALIDGYLQWPDYTQFFVKSVYTLFYVTCFVQIYNQCDQQMQFFVLKTSTDYSLHKIIRITWECQKRKRAIGIVTKALNRKLSTYSYPRNQNHLIILKRVENPLLYTGYFRSF